MLNALEIQFMKLCCSDMTYSEIAAQMNKSTRTVEGYRDSVLKKIGAKTRYGIILHAIKSKLYTPC